LALKEKQLETMRLDSQLQEEKLGADACARAAALVEEIYKAQRERDQAVMARLRLANEERDEALLRAKKLQEAALDLENINPDETDMDLEELLTRVSSAESALSIEQSGMAILERIQRARERRSKITSEEMKAVIEERDNALTRCKRLDQELLHTRELSQANTCHLNMANNQEQVHKIELGKHTLRGDISPGEQCQGHDLEHWPMHTNFTLTPPNALVETEGALNAQGGVLMWGLRMGLKWLQSSQCAAPLMVCDTADSPYWGRKAMFCPALPYPAASPKGQGSPSPLHGAISTG
ncbi:mirror-image polydactyly gene 1 protein isoform X2, partial [Tachysurus ichikawai]